MCSNGTYDVGRGRKLNPMSLAKSGGDFIIGDHLSSHPDT